MIKALFSTYNALLWAPLLAFPWMINLRVFPFVAPNEEPKWAVLMLCFLWMGLAAAWLCFKRKQTLPIPIPSHAGVLLGIYVVLLAVGISIGPNTTEGFVRFAFWVACISIFTLSIWAVRHEKSWLQALTWSIAIGSFIFSLRYWWSYAFDYGKPHYNIHVLFSPIGHVNFTGDVLIILLPVLLWALSTHQSPIIRLLNWFSVTTMVTILLLASSRGALGGTVLATVVILILAIKHYRQWQKVADKKVYYLPSCLVLSALVSSYVLYDALPYHYRDLTRISATAGQITTHENKKERSPNSLHPPWVDMWIAVSPVLGARTNIFASTTAMALETPLLGQGTGNFAWVYPSFSNRFPDFRDSLSSASTFTTNPHNVMLQIASQNGFVAMFIFIGLLLCLWWRLVVATWKVWHGWTAAGAAATTAVIFDAMFNHVFFNPASMFVFALLAGAWWGFLSYKKQPSWHVSPRIVASAMFVTVILLCVWPSRWLISEWYTGHAAAYIQYPAYESHYYQHAYQWNPENFRAVFGMGKVAYQKHKYAESTHYFEDFEQFYPYNPPALNMLAASYMNSGQLIKAQAALERALVVYPDFTVAKQNLQRVKNMLEAKQP